MLANVTTIDDRHLPERFISDVYAANASATLHKHQSTFYYQSIGYLQDRYARYRRALVAAQRMLATSAPAQATVISAGYTRVPPLANLELIGPAKHTSFVDTLTEGSAAVFTRIREWSSAIAGAVAVGTGYVVHRLLLPQKTYTAGEGLHYTWNQRLGMVATRAVPAALLIGGGIMILASLPWSPSASQSETTRGSQPTSSVQGGAQGSNASDTTTSTPASTPTAVAPATGGSLQASGGSAAADGTGGTATQSAPASSGTTTAPVIGGMGGGSETPAPVTTPVETITPPAVTNPVDDLLNTTDQLLNPNTEGSLLNGLVTP
jgi:hypothetical protein